MTLWRTHIACLGAVMALALVGMPVTAAPAESVRYWSLGDVTRIAIPTDGEKPVRSEQLTNPDRIFFDVQSVRTPQGSRKIQAIPVNDQLVRQIRYAETQPGLTRFVCDLNSAVEFTITQLANPDRVVIEIRRPAPPRPYALPQGVAQRLPGGTRLFRPPWLRVVRPELWNTPYLVDELGPAVFASRRVPEVPVSFSTTVFPRYAAPRRVVTAKATKKTPPKPPARDPGILTASARTSEGDRTMARVLGLKMTRIVIDAGHGGHDVGTSGPTGLQEKELVLDVARRLGALIHQQLGSEVIYTRSDDTFIPLEMRPRLANTQKADLFLSIHANSSPSAVATGVETYYLNLTASPDALDLAARENASSQGTISDLGDLVKQITLKDKVDESREFASCVQSSLASQASRDDGRFRDRGVRKAPFVVLIGARMPAILAEIGFLSNPQDEAQMRRPEVRQSLAEALYKGVSNYALTLNRSQVATRDVPAVVAAPSAGR